MQELGVLSDYVDPESNDWEEVPWGSRRVFVPYINKISILQSRQRIWHLQERDVIEALSITSNAKSYCIYICRIVNRKVRDY